MECYIGDRRQEASPGNMEGGWTGQSLLGMHYQLLSVSPHTSYVSWQVKEFRREVVKKANELPVIGIDSKQMTDIDGILKLVD